VLILLINLARRSDRLAAMDGQLGALRLPYERVEAIDGRNLLAVNSADPALTRGEIACHRSHRLAWQRLVDSGEDRALILEDDLLLSPRLPAFLKRPEALPDNADIVRLETRGEEVHLSLRTVRSPSGVGLRELRTGQNGAAAYILGRTAAMHLLSSDDSGRRPVDFHLFGLAAIRHGGLLVYQCDPALCIQGDVAHSGAVPETMRSDLEPERARARERRRAGLAFKSKAPGGLEAFATSVRKFASPVYRSLVHGDRRTRVLFDRPAPRPQPPRARP
jgi:glycosyl transferase family 25